MSPLLYFGCLWCARFQAFAVNYFVGSGSFVRALRYWARGATVCVEAAKKLHPDATGFKLSDQEFRPIMVTRASRFEDRAANETLLDPHVECSCETDIFRELGLSYVPFHMRFFGDSFQ